MREMIAARNCRRRRLDFAQHAVDAIAYAQTVLERLDVDVRGSGFYRPGDQPIDDPHDRRLARQIAQPLDIVLGAEVSLLTDGLHDLAGGAAAPEQAFEGGLDVGGHADPGQHRLAGEQLHRADRVAVERIRHGHGQASGGIGQGQNARLFQKIDADPLVRTAADPDSPPRRRAADPAAAPVFRPPPARGPGRASAKAGAAGSWLASRTRCARPSPAGSSRPRSTSSRPSASSTAPASFVGGGSSCVVIAPPSV